MKVTVKRRSKGIYGKRAKVLSKGLEGIAREGARTAERHARQGLQINVYQTEPGHSYKRTLQLLRQVYAGGHANRTALGIHVGDRAPYASLIEYGTGPYALSEAQLASYLQHLPPGGLLTFARSGKAYMRPGPYIAPAIWASRHATHNAIRKLLQDLWA